MANVETGDFVGVPERGAVITKRVNPGSGS